jgi:hypothetical protein
MIYHEQVFTCEQDVISSLEEGQEVVVTRMPSGQISIYGQPYRQGDDRVKKLRAGATIWYENQDIEISTLQK